MTRRPRTVYSRDFPKEPPMSRCRPEPTRRSFLASLGAAAAVAHAVPAHTSSSQAPSAQPTLDDTARLLKALSEAPGPSAFEEEVRRIVVAEYTALGAKIEYDGLGSVLATLPGNTTGPRVMVTAHMDEVGLMVQHITADGFIRVKILGGILEQALPDQRWTILGRNGPVPAISGLRTTHVLPPAQRGSVWSLDDTFLDVGARSREEAEAMGIRPGDGIAPMSDFLVMPNSRYAGKAWDDRVGLGVMIVAARRIRAEGLTLPAQIIWVATTQEEIGLRGAQTAVQKARPDLGISIEAGVSADYPAIGPTQAQERLGGGPGIFLLDNSMIPNRKLRDFFFDVARETKIPLQPNVLTGYGEDGAEIQRFDSGRPSVNMTVPTRYLHGHTGIIQRSDFDAAVELLLQVLRRLDAARVTQVSSFAA
jgi:putative aminopeptidase FrvX